MMLTDESLRRIDREVAKYPADQKQSAILAALAIAQDEKGHLANETIEFVAGYLGMPPVAAYEVATFYAMYELQPQADCKLTLCTNLPCALSGATEAAAHLHRRLGIGWNQTTPDGRFTLREGECFGACGDAPVMLLNNKRMLVGMTPARIDQTLNELSLQEHSK